MIVTKDDTYGADADNNRGTTIYEYELEDTPQEKEEIAEILYEAFASGCGLTGGATIEYEGIEIEVEIEDYHQELKKMLVEDMELDEESVMNIAQEIEDFDLIVDWKTNYKGQDMMEILEKENKKMKRYAVDFNMYLYAKSKDKAVEMANKMARIIDNCGDLCSTDLDINEFLRNNNDNKCNIVSVTYAGKVGK